MRILNKDLTEEERGDVLATIKKASVDVTDVLSELAAIIRALMLTYAERKRPIRNSTFDMYENSTLQELHTFPTQAATRRK